MKILVLAPQPFYADRGTPIAVRLLAETLCEAGHAVDLLTYHEGEDIAFPGLRLLRIPAPPLVRNVPIGFSWKKLACDVAMSLELRRLARQTRYDVVHAVEETVFPAVAFRPLHRAAVVYDMDSDLVDQLLTGRRLLRPFGPLLNAIERWAVRRTDLVIAVCARLDEKARRLAPGAACCVLEDIGFAATHAEPIEDLRVLFAARGPLALYVGNLEPYQGIDLLLVGFASAAPASLALVVIGGSAADIERYRERAAALGIAGRVHFAGPRPLRLLGGYLAQADILVSPRTHGENTPMKIYSYLASGRSILATNIDSHTQALDATCALLVPPDAESFGAGLRRLADDPALRERLGASGARRARERHSREAYRAKLLAAYAGLERDLANPNQAP